MTSFVFSDTKFGRKFSSVTTFNLVSEMGIVEAHYPASAAIITLSSEDATDSASSTGARQVRMEGFGSGYIAQTEDVWLAGTGAASTSLEWLRVDRMFVLKVGSNGVNVDNIWCGKGTLTSGVPDDLMSEIHSGQGQTSCTKFTVPVSHEARIKSMLFTSGKVSGQDRVSTFRVRCKDLTDVDGAWRVLYDADALDGQIGGRNPENFAVIAGPADVVVEASASGVGARQTAHIGYELHKKH